MGQTFLERSFDVSEYGLDNKNNNIQKEGEGELLISGSQVASGYMKNHEQTKKSFKLIYIGYMHREQNQMIASPMKAIA